MFSRRGSCLGFLLVFLMSFFPVSPASRGGYQGRKGFSSAPPVRGVLHRPVFGEGVRCYGHPPGEDGIPGRPLCLHRLGEGGGQDRAASVRRPGGTERPGGVPELRGGAEEKGYEILFSGSKDELGPYDSFAETLYGRDRQYPIPGDERTKNQQFLSARLVRTEGNVYVTVCAFENNFWGSETKMEKGRTYCRVDMVETKPMETKMVTVTSEEMARGLESSGKIALYGIYFDTDKADVKPESKAALEEMAKLLKTFPDLRVLVVGHTDSTGDREYNMGLSRRRAEAVVKSLRESYGIAASRLVPAGVGMLAPVASNRTEEGRAKNRRVELVEMQPSLQ